MIVFHYDFINHTWVKKGNIFFCLKKFGKKKVKNIKLSVSKLIKKSNIIKKILTNTYSGVFVDEYQDCSKSANELIEVLSDILPTRIFGDWLQAIFSFNADDPLVLYKDIHKDFKDNKFELLIPHRWKNNNVKLGEDLKNMRGNLLSSKKINLNDYAEINIISDDQTLKKLCFSLLSNKDIGSILIINPHKNNCRQIAKNLCYKYNVLESIDDKDFYKITKKLDVLKHSNNFQVDLFKFLELIFTKTSIEKYYKNNNFINKRKDEDKKISSTIKEKVSYLVFDFSLQKLRNLFEYLENTADFSIVDNRIELFKSICSSLTEAENKCISVYDAMKLSRDKIRHTGRHINNRAIDTTLLTKGLEFDVVIMVNADDIGTGFGQYDIKKWYVAASRAKKILYVHTKSLSLDFSAFEI